MAFAASIQTTALTDKLNDILKQSTKSSQAFPEKVMKLEDGINSLQSKHVSVSVKIFRKSYSIVYQSSFLKINLPNLPNLPNLAKSFLHKLPNSELKIFLI